MFESPDLPHPDDALEPTTSAADREPARRNGRRHRLLQGWLVLAMLYVAVAGALSAAPIRHAIAQAQEPAPPYVQPKVAPTGPLPEAPDSPSLRLWKVIGRQGLIIAAPPLLALWFGWDVWFAVSGLLSRDSRSQRPEA